MFRTFRRSHDLFRKTEKIIPLATQTFSKSYLQFVQNGTPLFLTHGKGSHVWDVDGNEYVDLISGLLPIVLGYRYPAVDRAIERQLKKGIIFSLPSPLEGELARLLIKHIPCAEMVRYGKNGSDVTTGAIRVARAYTGRERVAVCGYHGWHDWYIGTTARNLGVPKSTQAMTDRFEYNKPETLARLLKKHRGQYAAVILEPTNYVAPAPGFLREVKRLTHAHGALLVFDEVITGFRWGLGGAQAYFGVTPDLASFGKSMANGMPISALVGKRKYMKIIDDIFYSFTNGGEALSLAAAIATIREMERKPVHKKLWDIGERLAARTERAIRENALEDTISLKGYPCWKIIAIKPTNGFSDLEIRSYLQQELIQRGILWHGQHNVSLSHTAADIEKIGRAYDGALKLVAKALRKGDLKQRLVGKPITNIFKVR